MGVCSTFCANAPIDVSFIYYHVFRYGDAIACLFGTAAATLTFLFRCPFICIQHGKQGASRLDFMARFRFPKYRPSKDRQSTDDEDADAIDDLDIPLRDNERRRSCRLAGSGDDNEDWKQTCDDVHVEIYTLLYKEATNYGEEIPEWVLACSIFDFRKEFPVKDKYGEFLVQMKPKINTLRELVMNVKALHTDRDLVLPEVNPDESKDSSESESSDDNDDEASEGQVGTSACSVGFEYLLEFCVENKSRGPLLL